MLSRADTRQYPEVKPELPPRSRGVIALVEENCTVCMLCARECPDWCIYIDSHKETAPAPEGGRPRAHNVLDRFAIDFSLCMYCGICIEVCPFDALFWSPEFEYAEYDIRNLLHEKDRLGEWVETIPIPPPHEPNAEPPKELGAATRGSAGRAGTRPARERTGPDSGPALPGAADKAGAAGNAGAAGAAGPAGAAGKEGAAGAAGAAGPAKPDRTSHAAVRAIRPPGALPKRPEPDAPPEKPAPAPEPPQAPGPVGESPQSPASGREPGTGKDLPRTPGSVEEPPKSPGSVEEPPKTPGSVEEP